VRIVVSGTHASGKSTLISDFALRHPEFTVLADPFDMIDERAVARDPRTFAAQLRLAADRLADNEDVTDEDEGGDLLAERGPLDFLAYLVALAELGDVELDEGFTERAVARTAAALRTVDLLVVLPLAAGDGIEVGDEEDPELRDAMNDALLDLLDDTELIGTNPTIIEITGPPEVRLALLERAVETAAARSRSASG